MTTSEQEQGRRATVEGVWEMTVKFLHLRDQMVGRERRGRQSTLGPHRFEPVQLHMGYFRDSTGLETYLLCFTVFLVTFSFFWLTIS